MKMKKIAFIGTDNKLSGATLSMIALAKSLKDTKKYNPVIIIPSDGEIVKNLKENELKYYIVKSYPWVVKISNNIKDKILTGIKYYIKSFLNIFAIRKIEKIIIDEEIDLIHINSIYSYVGAMAAIKRNTKIVWHIREFLEEDQNAKLYHKEKSLKLIDKSTAIITISKSVYDKYSKLLNNNNIYMIYNGIDVTKYYNSNKEIFNNEQINLVMAGTIQAGKGQKELIKALYLLKKENVNNFYLTLLGYATPQNEKELIELIEKLELKNNVKYIGFNKNVNQFLDNADISFTCSKSEAYGRTTVEAMLCGCLVIGSDTAGTAELINNMSTGLLYKSGNEEDLKEKIKYAILNKDESKKMAQNGKEYAKENYTSEKNMNNIKKVYDTILGDE